MANYFTHFSCVLDVGTRENAIRSLELRAKLAADIAEEESRDIGFILSIPEEEGGSVLWMRDDETGEPEHVIRFVLLCAETFDLKGLWGFQWADTCSRPILDAYGGGAHAIDLGERQSLGWTNTAEWLRITLDRGDPDA